MDKLTDVDIRFDPRKSEWNARERGLPFARVESFDFATAKVVPTIRNGEVRREALGYLDDRLHVLATSRWTMVLSEL